MATYRTAWRNPEDKESSLVRDFTQGESFRPGKTRYEHANGVHSRHLQNVEAKRQENRKRDGKK